jgi:hypothetical protein
LEAGAEGRRYYLSRNLGQLRAVEFTTAAPRLGIFHEGANLSILWPAPSAGYVLQSSPALPPAANWTTVSTGIVTANGQKRLAVIPSGSAQFYRLARP